MKKGFRRPAAMLLTLTMLVSLLMSAAVFATDEVQTASGDASAYVQATEEETEAASAEETSDAISEEELIASEAADAAVSGTEEEASSEEASDTDSSTSSTYTWTATDSSETTLSESTSDSVTTLTITGSGTLTLTADTYASVTVSSGTVTIDLAGHSLYGNSGSATITVSTGANVTVKDSSSGAAGKVTHSASATDSDGNATTVYGCGVSVDGGTFTLESGSIYGNTAAVGTTGRGYGGGISAKNSATVYIKGGSVSYNTASLQGGGIYLISSSALTISGGEISYNTVDTTSSVTATSGTKIGDGGAGGGIMAWDGATITMTGGSITYNQANSVSTEGGGGGVEIGNGTTFTMSGGTISYNSTSCNTVNGKGGGVFVSSADSSSTKSTFSMSGGSISNNSSGGIGGGIYVNTVAAQYTAGNGINEVTITGGTISANTAGKGSKNLDGGGIYINCGTLTMTGGTISGNSASGGSGGGIFIASAIRSSYAYSTVTIGGSAAITGNTAANGGGIHCQYSYLTIEGDVVISNNTSTGARGGGGVLVTYSSYFTMTGGTITGNSAVYGGGLSLNRGNGSAGQVGAGSYSLGSTSGSYDTTGTTVVKITGGVIANNTASTAAADVQFGKDSRSVSGAQGVFNITSFTLNDNVEYGSTGYRITGWFEDGSSARYADTASPTAVTISAATGSTSDYSLIAASACYKSGHTWDSGTVTDPTCTEGGYTTYTCTVCGAVKTSDETAATGHSYVSEVTLEPTCTTTGITTFTCSVCGDTYTEELAALGHTWGEWVTVTEASCEEDGFMYRTCSVCGLSETSGINAAGHSWETDAAVDQEATCTQDGSKSIHCSVCDAVKDSVVIPATGHAYGDPVWIWTVAEDGYEATAVFTCENDTSHTLKIAAQVTSSAAEDAVIYTASVTGPDGETVYTDTLTEAVTQEETSSDGVVVVTDSVSDSAPRTTADVDEETLTGATLTDDEAAAVEAGGEATYTLTIQTQEDDAVSEEDIAVAEDYLDSADVTARYGDLTAGLYLDISLYLTVKDTGGDLVTDARKITSTGEAVYTITVTIPTDLINTDSGVTRTYYILCVHDGTPQILSSEYDADELTLTFRTSSFSTYAILYTDAETAQSQEVSDTEEATGDEEDADESAEEAEEDTAEEAEADTDAEDADDEDDAGDEETGDETDTDADETGSLAAADTGDTVNLSLWLLLLSAAGAALVLTMRRIGRS